MTGWNKVLALIAEVVASNTAKNVTKLPRFILSAYFLTNVKTQKPIHYFNLVVH